MTINEIIQSVLNAAQVVKTDATLFFCDDKTIATVERKNILISNIKLIKANIEALEKALV